MPRYRRAVVPGGTFFFTLVTEHRAGFLCDQVSRRCLREALHGCQQRWPFHIEAFVLLPDHLHAIWSLPHGDSDFSKRWALVKKRFTQAWLAAGGVEQQQSASHQRDRRRGVWQRRFWEHAIRDDTDLARHFDYIHYNPVKHGLVRCPHAWPHSSFHRKVRLQVYRANWACACERPATPLRFDDLDETAME
ncbi:MAG: transposase [Deltaproteobacteria bacterium]|nr:transposase [Deltaproteobacteria bacterium]MBI3389425.1 transposase [Deltaproteobacteria bacterium]